MKKKNADIDSQAMIQALLDTISRMQLTIDQLTALNQKLQGTVKQLTESNQKLQGTVDSLQETIRVDIPGSVTPQSGVKETAVPE